LIISKDKEEWREGAKCERTGESGRVDGLAKGKGKGKERRSEGAKERRRAEEQKNKGRDMGARWRV
jgi:hypothetical protein